MGRFPDGFLWGTAASAHQAEGGVPADDWWDFEHEPGRIDGTALDHYRRVIDAAHAAGIVPWVNLHHFVNPRWLAERGAFAREENLVAWRRFVGVIADALAHHH